MFKTLVQNSKVWLVLIVLLAGILRFYQLGTLPSSLTWDEVAWGYNAYALSIDGKDEFGKFLPYDFLLSFGDYKPPIYAYLAVFPVMIFGLTELAVRFPSALFGTLTVLVTYFLVIALFAKRENKLTTKYVALLAALFLAISPWHIMLSRAAFEANIATFFIVTGVWLFLLAVQKKSYLLILSTICFIASMYTFNSTRIVAPLLFLCLSLGFYKTLWKNKKYAFISLIAGIILILPIAGFLTSPEAKLRYAEVNIFSDSKIVETANQEIANDNNAWWSKIIHNRRVAYAREFLTHYFDHFNPQFLFISGDENPKFSTHDVGQMYLWDLPFLIIGILFLIRRREKNGWILPVWILIGIIPAAMARETPHALRIESTLPAWQILTAYGFVITIEAFSKIKYRIAKLKFQYFWVAYCFLLLLFYFSYYIHGYYKHYQHEYTKEWQQGYKEAINYVKANKDKYNQIYISDKMERGYVYTLFYLKYDPQLFRKEAVIRGNDFGFVHVDKFNKYYFEKRPPVNGNEKVKVLSIVGPDEVPVGAKIVKEFYLLDGKTILVAYTN